MGKKDSKMKGGRMRRMMVEKRVGYDKKRKRKGRRDMNREKEGWDRSKT